MGGSLSLDEERVESILAGLRRDEAADPSPGAGPAGAVGGLRTDDPGEVGEAAARPAGTPDAGSSGESAAGRQPIHTVYGGAHLFRADTARRLGDLALVSLEANAADPEDFARALGLPGADELPESAQAEIADRSAFEDDPDALRTSDPPAWLAHAVHRRVRDKLEREPVEDFRIDFEDGYGVRPDDEEDEAARSAARQAARGMENGTLPSCLGIRIKAMAGESSPRAVRTLDLFVTALLEATGGSLPPGFVVTLPKPTRAGQVSALADVLDHLEEVRGLEPGTVGIELMVEDPRALLDADGRCPLPALAAAGRGRCVAAHFGPYDYTAACGVTAEHQALRHPACDLARQLMQLAFARTPVRLADGPTSVLPLPVHRPPDTGELSRRQKAQNQAAVHRAWRLHHDNVRHALVSGFYQGWDLHPAQLPARYGAVHAFFLEGLEAATARLRNFVERAARATVAGGTFDDAATGQGLLNYFARGLGCGALTEAEVEAAGVTPREVHRRSLDEAVARRGS